MNQTLQKLCAASLGGDGQTMEPACRLALDANFGSAAAWTAKFGALDGAGPGWALLLFQPSSGALANHWVAEGSPAPAGAVPLLALKTPGLAEQAAQIDWARVYPRYRQAVREASLAWAAGPDDVPSALLLDVRRAGAYAAAQSVLPGARWLDPAAVAQWATTLANGPEVLVYCVFGHEVSQATTLRLRAAGVRARYLQGGIEGWQAAGRPTDPKEAGASS